MAAAKDPAADEKVAAQADAEVEQGFRGFRPDPTPLHHYTVPGVIAEKPTPETDPGLAEQAVVLQNVEES